MEPARRNARRRETERSFERLYRHHRDDVYRALLRELGNREDAEDVTQTAFLDAYRALSRGGRPLQPRAWLLRIAENARRRRFRAQPRGPEEARLEYEPASEEADVTAGELRDALERLPQNQRATLVLRELGGLSYAEIAARLELSVPAVQMLLFRARRALRAELEGERPLLARGLPAWPVPSWLAEAFSSPGGSLGVLPRAAGVVAAGATAAAMLPGATSEVKRQPARPQPRTVVADVVRPQPPTARRVSATRAQSEPRPRPQQIRPRATPTRQSRPAATPPTAHPPAAPPPAAPPPATAPPVAEEAPGPDPVPLPASELPAAPHAPPVVPPSLPPVPAPALPTLPPLPELPATPLPEAPVPAPPAGTGEPGGATIPALTPS